MVYDKIISGDNIQLRPVTLEDCNSNYLAWMKDTETNQYMETRWTDQTLDSIVSFVQSIRESSHSCLFAIVYQSQHIGNIKIGPVHPRYRNADVSYFIGEKTFHGRGLATEAVSLVVDFAFSVLNLHRIQGGAFRENVASQRVLQRNGFKLESVIKEKYFLTSEDNWTDCLEYVLFKKDWLTAKNKRK